MFVALVPSPERRSEAAGAMAVLHASWTYGWMGAVEWPQRPVGDPMVDGMVASMADVVDETIQRVRPELVLGPSPTAHHQDHRLLAAAVAVACRPSGGTGRHRPTAVATYEHPSDAWSYGPRVQPSMYVEVTEADVQRKLRAMTRYGSQVRPAPSERSGRAMLAQAAVRGSEAGVMYAEAFSVQRFVA